MNKECPICYEKYSDAVEATIPRRLDCCDLVLCTKCIKTDLIDGTFYCTECCFEHKANSVEEFPAAAIDTGESDISDEISSTGRSESPLTDVETEATDDSHSVPSSRPSAHARSLSENGLSSYNSSQATTELTRNAVSLRIPKNFKLHDEKKRLPKTKKPSNDFLLQANVDSFNGLEMSSINLVSVEGKRLRMKDGQGGWPDVNPDELIERFKKQGRMELGETMNLIDRAKAIVSRESTVLKLDAPLIVVGDIHGQFYDLLNLFQEGGKPGVEQTYLFLGDYVDRGSFSCEVMLSLLALKVTYPDRFGNKIK